MSVELISSEDVEFVGGMLRQAGAELMRWRPGGEKGIAVLGIEQKADGSLVSAADFAAQKIIFSGLGERFGDEAVLSEEGVLNERGRSRRSWIVDPLDGTREFLSGTADFAIQLACCIEGRVIAGWVYFPALNRLVVALDGGVARADSRVYSVWEREKLEPTRVLVRGCECLDPRVLHPIIDTQVALRRLLAGELDVVIIRLGSLGVWDVAGWSVIVKCAGGVVCDEHGEPVPFGARIRPPSTVIFAVPGLKDVALDIAKSLPGSTALSESDFRLKE